MRADVLVIFGITGDLAKVMTFRSLYRLERRGLLDCPIVGVAVDDWTVERLREHARESIEACGEELDAEVFERFAARLSYLSGNFTNATNDAGLVTLPDGRKLAIAVMVADSAAPAAFREHIIAQISQAIYALRFSDRPITARPPVR